MKERSDHFDFRKIQDYLASLSDPFDRRKGQDYLASPDDPFNHRKGQDYLASLGDPFEGEYNLKQRSSHFDLPFTIFILI